MESLWNPKNVAIISAISGTGSLNLHDVSFVVPPSPDRAATCPLPCGPPSGAKYASRLRGVLANAGVVVVFSWEGPTVRVKCAFRRVLPPRGIRPAGVPRAGIKNVEKAVNAAYADRQG